MEQMDKKTILFEQTPVPKAVAQLAVPTVLSSLVMVLYNLADTYFVGQLNNPVQNAAVTLAFGEGAILTGDEVNVSAPNAAYTTAEAGTGIAINFGSLTVTGKDAG